MDRQREIMRAVMRMPEKLDHKKQTELLTLLTEYAGTLHGRSVQPSDLHPGGLIWPESARNTARKAEVLSMLQKIQAGPIVVAAHAATDEKKAPKRRSRDDGEEKAFRPAIRPAGLTPAAAAAAVDPESVVTAEHEGDIFPNETFDLPKSVLKEMKAFTKDSKSNHLVDIVLGIFAAIYEERERQDVEVARTLDVAAFTNDPNPKTDQMAIVRAFPQDVLQKVVTIVNAEVRRFNRLEASFETLAKHAKHEALNAPKGAKAVNELMKDESKLKDLEAKGAPANKIKAQKTAIKRAKEVVEEIIQDAEAKQIKEATRESETAMEKRIRQALMGRAEYEKSETKRLKKTALEMAELTEEKFLEGQLKQMKRKYPQKTSKELLYILKNPKKAAVMEEEEALRATFMASMKKTRKDLNEAARHALIDQYLAARQEMLAASQGSAEEAAAERKVKAFEREFGIGKGVSAADEDDEEDEEDDEFKPDDEDDDDEDDDDDDDDDEEAKSGGTKSGGRTRTRARTRPPKSYSGAGAFPKTLLAPHNNFLRRAGGGQCMPEYRYRRILPAHLHMPLINRRPRKAGGCGCDPLSAPKDDD